ncbi:MAG: hypothetical protein HA494_07695 [Thaumarchaeota archaeon]|nr:hypothetical protein [Nitrososphaerota archaeon]
MSSSEPSSASSPCQGEPAPTPHQLVEELWGWRKPLHLKALRIIRRSALFIMKVYGLCLFESIYFETAVDGDGP